MFLAIQCMFGLVISGYLSSLPVAHLSDAPRRRLVIIGDQEEATQSSVWFFNLLGVYHRHTGPRFKVSPERPSVIFSWLAGDSNP